MGLSPEQRKKVSEYASAIELRALRDVVTRQQAGKKLTGADMRLLERLQIEETMPEQSHANPWLPIQQVAEMIGLTEQGIRGWTRRKENALQSQRIEGAACVQPWTTYEYARKFARRAPGLKPPPEIASKTEIVPQETPRALTLTSDPHDVLREVVKIMQAGKTLFPNDVQALVAAARELRQKDESDQRAAQMYDGAAVEKMLREVGEAWVQQTDAHLERISRRLVAHIKSELGIDLEAQNITAAQNVEAFLRNELAVVIDAVKETCREKTERLKESAA